MEVKYFSESDARSIMDAISETDVMVFDHVDNLPQNETIHSESYILLLCLDGKASCRLSDKVYEVQRNDLFLCHPQQFVENAMASLDFKCKGLILSPQYLESIFLLGGNIWNAKSAIQRNPLVHLTEEEMQIAVYNNAFIQSKLKATSQPHYKEMIKLLLQSLIFEFYDTIVSKLDLGLDKEAFSAAETIFCKFMDMAESETPRQREVRYYADKLCVSAKYLSAICKKRSGYTASEILNHKTIERLKYKLRSSNKSIKEIAVEAGFDNISFFGKYVRRQLGVSPREYRRQNLIQDI